MGRLDMRVVVWFSAGAASAVAAKLVLAEGPATLVYTDPGSEHPDNQRFMADCEEWFGQEIIQLCSEKYEDTWAVWEHRRFLVSPQGAPCTIELKKKMRQQFERPTDIQVFGYTHEEQDRADLFRDNNPGVTLRTPLIEQGLNKAECFRLIQQAGIDLPVMYKLGYRNNNCIGCVKGGMGYWNKIRRDFPDVFNRMAKLERDIGATLNRADDEPVWLDELDPSRGNYTAERDIQCSLFCPVPEL
jgi:3'-phosphoadenosine 5'-phosphosulfate sulfotransferase (PAPS reductase)/FAD synthetase